MRSGEEDEVCNKVGGAWYCTTMRSAPNRFGGCVLSAGSTECASDETVILFTEADCTKGECVEGMVSQQFLP